MLEKVCGLSQQSSALLPRRVRSTGTLFMGSESVTTLLEAPLRDLAGFDMRLLLSGAEVVVLTSLCFQNVLWAMLIREPILLSISRSGRCALRKVFHTCYSAVLFDDCIFELVILFGSP